MRGGGSGVGIATSFTYRLHPVGPDILAGSVLWALEDMPEVLGFYREFGTRAPRELNTVVKFRRGPDLPTLPPALHGWPVGAVAFCYLGDPEAGERVLGPMRTFGRPLLDGVTLRPYTGLQSMANAEPTRGWH